MTLANAAPPLPGPELSEKDISATPASSDVAGSGSDRSDASDTEAATPKESEEQLVPSGPVPLKGFKLVSVVASVMLAVLCIALDNTSQ
jgi:hypothetical protein